jgi:hypothetical protein
MKHWGTAIALVGLLGLTGCSRPLKDRITGKWQHTSGSVTMEFLKDGSFVGNAGPVPLSGSFTTPDQKHVRIEGAGLVGGLLGPQVYEARQEKESLQLIAGATQQEFKRVER